MGLGKPGHAGACVMTAGVMAQAGGTEARPICQMNCSTKEGWRRLCCQTFIQRRPLHAPADRPPCSYVRMLDSEGFFYVPEIEDSDSCLPCKRCGCTTHVIKKDSPGSLNADATMIAVPGLKNTRARPVADSDFGAGQNRMRLEPQTAAGMRDECARERCSHEDIASAPECHGIRIHFMAVVRMIKNTLQ